jgi:hypothetical protein
MDQKNDEQWFCESDLVWVGGGSCIYVQNSEKTGEFFRLLSQL